MRKEPPPWLNRILYLLAKGYKHNAIAAALRVSPLTVAEGVKLLKDEYFSDEPELQDSHIPSDRALLLIAYRFLQRVTDSSNELKVSGLLNVASAPFYVVDRGVESILRDDVNSQPRWAEINSKLWSRRLEEKARQTRERLEWEKLHDLAQLVNAWALTNTLPTARLQEAIDLAEGTRRRNQDAEIKVLRQAFICCTLRMKSNSVDQIEKLEALRPLADRCRPFIAGIWHEEMGRQHLLSDQHGLEIIKEELTRGKELYSQDPDLKTRIPGFDDILGRAMWRKEKDPKSGAALVKKSIDQLLNFGRVHSDLLVRAYAHCATLQLEAGMRGNMALEMFLKAYEEAKSAGIVWWIESLEHLPLAYGINLKEEYENRKKDSRASLKL